MSADPKFHVGSRVMVTGDSARVGHEFPAGTIGVVEDPRDDEGGAYRVQGPLEFWWVNEADLVHAADPLPIAARAIHEVPGIECDHIDGKQPSCERDAEAVIEALRADGFIA